MAQCCDADDVAFTLAFTISPAPRLPADGAPLSAYFDFIDAVPIGLETSHLFKKECLTAGGHGEGEETFVGPIVENPDVVGGSGPACNPNDTDQCDKPQLAFAPGVVISGTT